MPPPAGGAPPIGGPKPMGPPAGTGPAAAPGGMQGNMMAGMMAVKEGVQLLLKSLNMLPLGGELQMTILDALQKIGKHVPEAGMGGDPGGGNQVLAMMARQNRTNPMQDQAIQQMTGGGGMPPPAGGAPPPGAGAPAGGM